MPAGESERGRMARVLLQGVDKTYPGGMAAVEDFNLDVADREFVVFVGPSGCGKSTTLRMRRRSRRDHRAAPSTSATAGERRAPQGSRHRDGLSELRALPAHDGVREHGVRAQAAEGAEATTIKSKVQKAAKILGIEQMLDRKPKTLSGGQRQRVAVGRAIVRDPKCFLFDEPLSNLDAKLRVEMRAEIKRIHLPLESTTIYVTHDQEEAMTLGDRVVVMKDGVIQQCDAPLEVYHRPEQSLRGRLRGHPSDELLRGDDRERRTASFGSTRVRRKLAVPAWAEAALADRVGSRVVMGIRPQGISDVPRGDASDNVLAMRVGVVEVLGEKMDVHLSTASHARIVAHVDAHRGLTANETRAMYIDPSRMHFFETGELGARLATAPSLQ